VSRIGKKPIEVPQGVTISRDGDMLKVKGPNGELQQKLVSNISVEVKENEIIVTRPNDSKQNKSLHGLTRALIQNMVTGVNTHYKKTLDIVGVGYRAELKGKNLLLNIGYSHPIYFKIPECITMEATQPINNTSSIKMSGIDKELVGLIADKIRSFKKPEPYKGKGLRYSDEVIIRKAGKTAKK